MPCRAPFSNSAQPLLRTSRPWARVRPADHHRGGAISARYADSGRRTLARQCSVRVRRYIRCWDGDTRVSGRPIGGGESPDISLTLVENNGRLARYAEPHDECYMTYHSGASARRRGTGSSRSALSRTLYTYCTRPIRRTTTRVYYACSLRLLITSAHYVCSEPPGSSLDNPLIREGEPDAQMPRGGNAGHMAFASCRTLSCAHLRRLQRDDTVRRR